MRKIYLFTKMVFAVILICYSVIINAQESDDAKKSIVLGPVADTLRADSIEITESAPLDIARNRGLFIVTPDQKMQLRILGSVRYLVVYDNLNLSSKNSFLTYEIPTGEANQKIPNYYNGLQQTRLGFEITRKTGRGDVFIRLETDFAGKNGFRIRHAYGQIHRFLFGQTWSLFSHLKAFPATVDFSGPTGCVIARTPQIRYSIPDLIGNANVAFGLEYFPPSLKVPDSLRVETFQVIPDLTIRVDNNFDWGFYQISGIIPMLSGRDDDGLGVIPGWGISASVVLNSWARGKWYFQGVGGQAISRYFDDLGGQGFDVLFPPESGISVPVTYGFYATYEFNWTKQVFSNLSYGMVRVKKLSFTPVNTFHKGHSVRMNTFWNITDGAKAGAEMVWGNRVNKGGDDGDALRFNLLFYYDF